MKQTVIGIFNSSTEAQQAVERLSTSGFSIDQVDVSYNNNQQTGVMGQTDSVDRNNSDDDSFGEKISRFFKSMFDDDDESSRYSSAARNAAIVTVMADSSEDAERASEILDSCGAVDVDERAREFSENRNMQYGSSQTQNEGENRQRAYSDTDTDELSGSTTSGRSQYDQSKDVSITNESDRDRRSSDENTRSIPVMEEHLKVDKREVERGGVRVRSRIIERPVEESVRLREERVSVERNPVNRPANEGDLSTFREGDIEMKQRSEVPVVNKEARVVEEVKLNRDVTEREEVIRDTVRKTEVEIDESTLETDSDTRVGKRKRKDQL